MCVRFAGKWGLDPADPFRPTFHPERLNEVDHLKGKKQIFVGSMCDLFGDWVPKEWIQDVIDKARFQDEHYAHYVVDRDGRVKQSCPRTFIFLTKNPRRYAEFDFPPNCWLGVTVTGQIDYQKYLGLRRQDSKNIKFMSYEPILGSFDFFDFAFPDWLILGAMTGPGAKKYAPDPRWIADAVAQCRARGIPVFMKNSIRPYWTGEMIRGWPR